MSQLVDTSNNGLDIISVADTADIAAVSTEKVLIDCHRCGMPNKERHPTDHHLCIDCVKAENNRLIYYRQHQHDWIEKAKDAGIDLWLQQPSETQWEYTIWTKYRDSYPGKKPTYGQVARELDTTYNVVAKVAQRWSFPVRMQAWMVNIDQITLVQRRQEILDMNKTHIDMAKKANRLVDKALDRLDGQYLKPNEIVNLGKMAAELERKALDDNIKQEEIRNYITSGNMENPDLKKSETKSEDLAEVVKILMNAGALGDLQIATVGVRQVETVQTTTEVIAADASGEKVIHNRMVSPESNRKAVQVIGKVLVGNTHEAYTE